jgi:sulfate adenylyltransferase subunit 1 (EFTu-like GTPase family)
MVAKQFEATLVWMHEEPLQPGASVLLQHGAAQVPVRVLSIVHRIKPDSYEAEPVSRLALNEIGLVRLETARALVFDKYRDNRQTGSCILIDRIHNFTLAAGMIEQAVNVGLESAPVTPVERLQRYGHRPGVIMCPSTSFLKALERELFDRGAAVVLLETAPSSIQLQQLLANGLLVLAPPLPIVERKGVDWIEKRETTAIQETVRDTLSELKCRRLLLSREEGI